jgi:hypothetical protein
MATRSAFVIGKINQDFSHSIWEPDTDIKIGVWGICLQKVVIKLKAKVKDEFCFCVKTNFVEQNERDKQGRFNVIKTCLGLFSCKGEVNEEIVITNSNCQYFTITRPENDLIISIDNPLTKKIIETEHAIGCYFVIKRLQ